ncbi:MAG: hypothetical protein ACXVDA_25570 [Ktedonobacterales bacterium]
MSLPPSDGQPAPADPAARRGIPRRMWLPLGALTLALSAIYLLLDIAIDPVLLSHAAQAGHLPLLLVSPITGFVVSSFFLIELELKRSRVEKVLNVLGGLLSSPLLPIVSIAWVESHMPDRQVARMVAIGFGLSLIGLVLFTPSLAYGLHVARQRNATTDSNSDAHSDLQSVGLRPAIWIAASAWSFLLVAAIIYAMWSTLTSSTLDSGLFVPLAIFACAFIIVMVTFFWLWFRARRYARQTGDAVLLFSTGQFSSTHTASQRAEVPPDERPRWGIALSAGLGLVAFSVLTSTVLDRHLIQSSFIDGNPPWFIWILIPLACWMGVFSASARRYEPARFRQLLAAATAFVVAGDAMLIDVTHPRHAIVPPVGLLAIAVPCSTLGVLICRSLLLHPVWEVNTDPNVAMPLDPAPSHESAVAGSQRQPQFAPHLMLLQPLLIVIAHLVFYSDAAIRREWGAFALGAMGISMTFTLLAVVRADLPQRQANSPVKKVS